ncbi:MAG: SDR family NAD(P)-dependent oxidoreductase, partial [Myxococcales bacterium]|nr:SDR family NAD(P)-dependent oxidoreductase [Myxococcales bacterium]
MSPYRNALVTGASSGIGRALAIELARAGAPLCILAARRERELDDVAREVRAAGGRAVTCVADVGDTDAWVARVRRLDV